MEGNREADKLATKGVELHMVPAHQVAMVQAQDKLVEELCTMLLSVMKGVHDKAPARKKEEKDPHTGSRKVKLHEPKVGSHGAHFFRERQEGGWECRGCKRHSTTHQGWRRMVRTPCGARPPASRVRRRISHDRRLWPRIRARKQAVGDHSANHEPVRGNDGKWICEVCGRVAIKPSGLGSERTGAPRQGST
eukprot:1283364-Heterocapsa_arctica.AAC.1